MWHMHIQFWSMPSFEDADEYFGLITYSPKIGEINSPSACYMLIL